MFVRQHLDMTIGSAKTLLAERTERSDFIRVAPEKIQIVLDASDPVFRFGEEEVPVTESGLSAMGDLLQIPTAFMKRMQDTVPASTKDLLLNGLLQSTLHKDAKIVTTEMSGVISIEEWGKGSISPKQVMDVASNVLGDEAPIARWIDTSSFFGFDAYVPEGFEHGYGGEGVTAYADGNVQDDITAGGLRFGIDLKRGLAPFTQEWMFRLACTNGYEVARDGLKVDARGNTVDEVLAELEQMAQIAFGHVEDDIRHFYDMKNQKVDNPERAIRTIARERGIPDRSTMALIDLAATEDLPDEASMFDIVNLITNFANSPSNKNDGGRLLLERAGGATIHEHGRNARCGHCAQKIQ